MSEEPNTPEGRTRFIVARIESAMRDFAATHPFTSRSGERVHGSYRWLSVVVPPHYEPVSVCDWSLQGARQSEAGAALASAMESYVEGQAGLSEVKTAYQAFAQAHLVWWVDGRMFYAEEAARLAVVEGINEHLRTLTAAPDTAAVAHPVGEVAQPRRGPRLAYSRGRAQVNN